MTTFTTSAALIIGAAACVTDLHSRRIPNWLTFGAAAAALATQYAGGGPVGAQHAMSGWITGLLLFMPLFLLGGMGAGDVKLLAALGAWLGTSDTLFVALYAGIAGGVMAVIVSAARGYMKQLINNLWGLLIFWRIAGLQPMPGLTLRTAS